jgi:hypothetical protein
MTSTTPLCSCPYSYDDNRQLVRVALDSACPIHANRKAEREPPHCPSCSCGLDVPIVQTVEVAREMVKKDGQDE